MINPLKEVEVSHFILRHPRVPPGLAGFRIAQITDIHMGRWVKPRHIADLVARVNEERPELVALTGDYVGYSAHDIEPCVEALAGLQVPSFAVLGNHDHWASTERCVEAFARSGIELLQNASRRLEHRGVPVEIVGVDDLVTKHADPDAAFAQIEPVHFCLTLNHVPSLGGACAERGAHLILSGHTHGYQFNIPRMTHKIAETFGAEYHAGPYRIGEAFLYISRGLGSASWPWRIRARPEFTYFTLEPTDGAAPQLELQRVERASFGA